MQKTIYEIKIIEKTTVTFIKKYISKYEAMCRFDRVLKSGTKSDSPKVIISQIDFDEYGKEISSSEIMVRYLRIGKMNLETAKIKLSE
jgi:hypothetical protein